MSPEDPNFIDGIYKGTYDLGSVFSEPDDYMTGFSCYAHFTVPPSQTYREEVGLRFLLVYDFGPQEEAYLQVRTYLLGRPDGYWNIDLGTFDPKDTESVRLLLNGVQATGKKVADDGPRVVQPREIFSALERYCKRLPMVRYKARLAREAEQGLRESGEDFLKDYYATSFTLESIFGKGTPMRSKLRAMFYRLDVPIRESYTVTVMAEVLDSDDIAMLDISLRTPAKATDYQLSHSLHNDHRLISAGSFDCKDFESMRLLSNFVADLPNFLSKESMWRFDETGSVPVTMVMRREMLIALLPLVTRAMRDNRQTEAIACRVVSHLLEGPQ